MPPQYHPYLEQLERTKRFLNLIEAIENGDKNQLIGRWDAYLTFFIHCHHLTDWVLQSKVVSQTDLDAFKAAYELHICRQIATGIKHLVLNRANDVEPAFTLNKANNPNNRLGFPYHSISRSYDPFDQREFTSIAIDGEEQNALEVARKCLELWLDFLKKHNLPTKGLGVT